MIIRIDEIYAYIEEPRNIIVSLKPAAQFCIAKEIYHFYKLLTLLSGHTLLIKYQSHLAMRHVNIQSFPKN